jgi:hypothetical protein
VDSAEESMEAKMAVTAKAAKFIVFFVPFVFLFPDTSTHKGLLTRRT